jgi:hypothetical protein
MSSPPQVSTSSSHLGSMLDVALTEFKESAGKDLLSHPHAIELQCCDSVDGILAILQRRSNTFEKLKDGNRGLMKYISSSVNILYSISATLGDGVSLVRLGKELSLVCNMTLLSGIPTCETNLYGTQYSPRGLYLLVRCCVRLNGVRQVAKDVSGSFDVLLDLFKRMDDFFKRFKVYSQSVVKPELAEVLVKVVVKVLTILSVLTKEMEQSRTSESLLMDMPVN